MKKNSNIEQEEEKELSDEQNKSQYMSAPIVRRKQQKQLQNKADLLRTKSSFQEAVSAYLNSVLLDRNNPETYLGLGICYKNLGKTKKSYRIFGKVRTFRCKQI